MAAFLHTPDLWIHLFKALTLLLLIHTLLVMR